LQQGKSVEVPIQAGQTYQLDLDENTIGFKMAWAIV
jgi:hypothetical protein